MINPFLFCAITTAATWDAWRFFIKRASAQPEEAAALVLIIASVALAGLARASRQSQHKSPLSLVAVLLVL